MVSTIEKPEIEREKLVFQLYQECFPAAARLIQKRGGSLEEAKDVFQDALIIYYERVVVGGVEIKTSAPAYIVGITKHLWSKVSAKKRQVTELSEDMPGLSNPAKPAVSKLKNFLESAGEKCMELLQSFYYQKLSMEQIAEHFGYGSERSATVQKYKCIEKVRNKVKEESVSYEDFFE